MQNNENTCIDARPFTEIWKALSANEQSELRTALTTRLDITRQTVYAWSKGVKPVYRDMKKRVSELVNKTLGIKTVWVTLFP